MVSVIVCSINPAKFAATEQMYHRLLAAVDHEIIGIHDARGLCEGYTRGMARSRGEILVFSHDDIEILTPDFAQRLTKHLQQFDVIGVAGTDQLVGMLWAWAGLPHLYGQVAHPNQHGGFDVEIYSVPRRANGGMQAMDGVFLAARRDVALSIGFDAQQFDGFHGYDADFTFRAHLAGHKLAVCGDIALIHYSKGQLDENWKRYADLFARKFADRLAANPNRVYRIGVVRVGTKRDVLEVMTPQHWSTGQE